MDRRNQVALRETTDQGHGELAKQQLFAGEKGARSTKPSVSMIMETKPNSEQEKNDEELQSAANSILQLSSSAQLDLRRILAREVGEKAMKGLSDEDINHFGCFLLTVHAEALKHRQTAGIIE